MKITRAVNAAICAADAYMRPLFVRGKFNPEEATKIANTESDGAVLRIQFIDARGNVGSQRLPMASDTEWLKQNRLDIA